MSLREKLDVIMPGWERWYPSVFDAAHDLGLIRARVCPPSQLMLSNRHAGIQSEAIEHDPEVDSPSRGGRPGSRRGRPPEGPRRKLRKWKP
jgi:hypothetical protein